MAWVGRVTGTFAGCIVGLLIWTIGAGGSGRGTPYGMVRSSPTPLAWFGPHIALQHTDAICSRCGLQGAACAVAFPIVTLFRLYYPGPPLTRIIFTVSQALVVGYGWQSESNLPSILRHICIWRHWQRRRNWRRGPKLKLIDRRIPPLPTDRRPRDRLDRRKMGVGRQLASLLARVDRDHGCLDLELSPSDREWETVAGQ